MAMKYAIQFSNQTVQDLAERLLDKSSLNFLDIGSSVYAPSYASCPTSADAVSRIKKRIADAKKTIEQIEVLLTLVSLAVQLNEGSYEGLYRFRDQEEEEQ